MWYQTERTYYVRVTKTDGQSMQCQAAINAFWASMSNSSGYYSPYPSCFIQPDVVIVKQLKKAGIMINSVDLSQKFYDPMEGFWKLAMKRILSNKAMGLRSIII